MKARDIAGHLGVSVETIYNWASVGLIDMLNPSRVGRGHRNFDAQILADLILVRRLQVVGLSAQAAFELVSKDRALSAKVTAVLSGDL